MEMYGGNLGSDVCDPQAPASRPHGEREFLSSAEACAVLRVSKNTLYRHAGAGRIPGAFKVGGTWRFRRVDLTRWRERGRPGLEERRR